MRKVFVKNLKVGNRIYLPKQRFVFIKDIQVREKIVMPVFSDKYKRVYTVFYDPDKIVELYWIFIERMIIIGGVFC